MATAGKNALLKISTNGSTFTTCLGVKSASASIDGANLDTTVFGDSFMERIQGIKDFKVSISGFYVPGDTTGQQAIRSALINDTLLYVQFLPDGTTGFQMLVKVSKFDVQAGVESTADVSIELEGAASTLTLV